MLLRLFIAALWLPAGKGLTSMLIVFLFFLTFPCGTLGQVLYLIVSFPDLCRLSYFQWDTDLYKSEDFFLNPVCMLFCVHIIVQLYACIAIQIKYV